MATYTWRGGLSGHPNDASLAGNWTTADGSAPLPSDGDTVLIPNNTAFPLEIPSGATLTNNVLQVGANDTVSLNTDLLSGGSIVTGAGAVLNVFDSTVAAPITVNGNTTINVSGDLAQTGTLFNNGPSAELIPGSVFTSLSNGKGPNWILTTSGANRAVVFNAAGNVYLDNGFLASSTGGSLTINVTGLTTGTITLPGTLNNAGGVVLVGETGSILSSSNAVYENQGFSFLQNASLSISANMAGVTGSWAVHNSTLDIATKLPGPQTVVMGDASGGSLLKIEATKTLNNGTVLSAFTARIAGFQAGDSIELAGITGLTGNYLDGVLTLSQGAATVGTLRFAANQSLDGGAGTNGFTLTSSGGNTFITTSQTTDFATNTGNAGTIDWNNGALWNAGARPGGTQVAEIGFTPAQLTGALSGSFQTEVITVTSAETVGSLIMSNPLSTLDISSTLTAQRPGAGQTSGGKIVQNDGTLAVESGGTLNASSLSQVASGAFDVTSGGVANFSGSAPYSAATGYIALDIEGDGTIDGQVNASGGVLIGQDAGFHGTIGNTQASLTLENGATLVDAFSQLAGQSNGSASVTITGVGTTWRDAGDSANPNDASPYLGGMVVGGGGVNFLGSIQTSNDTSNGYAYLNVDQGATVDTAGSGIIGVTGLGSSTNTLNSTGNITVQNDATWKIGAQLEVGGSHVYSATGNFGGIGRLNVQFGAQVKLGTIETAGLYKLAVGLTPGSNGNLYMQGTDPLSAASTLDAGGGPMVIGEAGQGNVTVSFGSVLSGVAANATAGFAWGTMIGDTSGAFGQFNIVGGGFSGSGDMVVGNAGSGNLMFEGQGGFVLAGSLLLGGTASGAGGGTGIANMFGLQEPKIGGNVQIYAGSTLNVGSNGLLIGSTGSFGVANTVTVMPGATLGVAGRLQTGGTLLNNGSVIAEAAGQTLDIGTVDGTGIFTIDAGAALRLSNSTNVNLNFAAGNGTASETAILSIAPSQAALIGFYGSDRVDLPNINFTNQSPVIDFPSGSNIATLKLFGGSTLNGSIAFNAGSGHSKGFTLQPDGGSGTLLVPNDAAPPCFAQGTRIATIRGDIPVEALGPGMRALLADGGSAEIVWLGHRRVDCRRHARPHDVLPVRVAAGAFAPGQPARDLFLSPDHAVGIGGVLIPIRYLLNGRTIAQQPADSVTYWHVELSRHAVLLAEDLGCESYLDTGNRNAFANGGGSVQLHPDFAQQVWEVQACAPLVRAGAALAAARRTLLDRAAELGYGITTSPGLSLAAGGRRLTAEVDGRRWRVPLPEGVRQLRLRSRTWVPAHTCPNDEDTRQLGVAIGRLWLDRRAVALDSPGLAIGWRTPEPGWRWTDGNAALSVQGLREVAFELALEGHYWCRAPQAQRDRRRIRRQGA